MKKKFERNLIILISAALMIFFTAISAFAATPKYVFFFLGDGMASSQIQATEAYLATKYAIDNNLEVGPKPGELNAGHLLNPLNRLNMTQMPISGMQTTFDSFALMTDSASSATAFASGIKTRSGVINMDPYNQAIAYKSIAQLAHERGMKVGIISSVPLNHATPAAYYASVKSRGQYNDIAAQMVETGYEFFGGGGLLSPESPNNIWEMLDDAGYSVLNNREKILELKTNPMDKVVCINPWLQDGEAMPYAIDRPEGNLSLAEMTEVGIAVLQGTKPGKSNAKGDDKGFFLMVEGGKIDWACHANDAMAAIGDMIDFDKAVGVALEFYTKYPNDTLIVVTGDHETGGMAVGHATTGYRAYYDRLLGQKNSFVYFGQNLWKDHKDNYDDDVCSVTDWKLSDNVEIPGAGADMAELLEYAFGMAWNDFNSYQVEKLDDAYYSSMCGYDKTDAKNQLLYGGYEPIIVTITHILNEKASIGWTSYAHTGVPVPVFAQGRKAEVFSGFYDNTDIARQLAKAIGIQEELPIEK